MGVLLFAVLLGRGGVVDPATLAFVVGRDVRRRRRVLVEAGATADGGAVTTDVASVTAPTMVGIASAGPIGPTAAPPRPPRRFETSPPKGVERRAIGYRQVRVSAGPDDVRTAEVGRLDRGDEIELATALDDAGLLVGIVTDRDIRLNLPSPATSLSVWEINYLVGRLTVGEVMSRTVLTVDPHRDVRSAARILIDHKIGALPVLDGARLVGIVTDTDLLRALATTTAELATAG